jgi:hypothetical protein
LSHQTLQFIADEWQKSGVNLQQQNSWQKKKTARLKMDHLICSRSAASLCGGKSVLDVVLGIGPCGPVRRIFGPIQRPPLPRVLCFAPRHGVQAGDDSDGAEQAAMKRTLYLLSKLSGADSIFLITKHKKKCFGGLLFRERNVPSDVQLLVKDDGGARGGEQLSTVQPCRSSALASLIFTLSCRLIN